MAGILLPLPYAALSLLKLMGPSNETDLETDGVVPEILPVGLFERPLLCSLICAAISLLFLGLYGKVGNFKNTVDDYTVNEPRTSLFGGQASFQALKRVLSIWLPFYACLMLDSDIVTVVMFLGLSVGFTPALRERTMPNLKVSAMSMIKLRKITVAFLAAMMLFDMGGISSSYGIFHSMKGFMSLGLALFGIPDTYPSPWNIMPAVRNKSGSEEKPHSKDMDMDVALQEDSTINILTGSALAVSVLIFHTFMYGFPPLLPGVSLLLLASFCVAASHLHPIVSSSSGFRESGFIAGAAVMTIIIPTSTSTPQSNFEMWSTLGPLGRFLLAYLSTVVDSKLSPSHSHAHSHDDTVKPPSKATLWLLGACENWPFIHAIIKERDSRRIFYFMWFVYTLT